MAVSAYKDGVFVKTYASQSEAADELLIGRSGICNAIKGNIKSVGGYTFVVVK